MIGVMQGPPSFAVAQGLADVRMRAMAAALLLLIINLIGGGVGPQAVGIMSDTSLRRTPRIPCVTHCWRSAWFSACGRRCTISWRRRPSGESSVPAECRGQTPPLMTLLTTCRGRHAGAGLNLSPARSYYPVFPQCIHVGRVVAKQSPVNFLVMLPQRRGRSI